MADTEQRFVTLALQLLPTASVEINPVEWAEQRLGIVLDEWQRNVLTSGAKRMLLVCPRQSGKSTIVGCLAGSLMVAHPGIKVVVLSPTQRQSSLLAAKVSDVLGGEPVLSDSVSRLVLSNGSSLDSLPGDQPKTIRGATADVLVIDEASRIKDELVAAALPMVAATDGRILMLSTPAGSSGAFSDFWHDEQDDWERVFVTAEMVPRYSKSMLDGMRRRLGARIFAQEFSGEFLEAPGQLFSNADLNELFARRLPWEPMLEGKTDYQPLI